MYVLRCNGKQRQKHTVKSIPINFKNSMNISTYQNCCYQVPTYVVVPMRTKVLYEYEQLEKQETGNGNGNLCKSCMGRKEMTARRDLVHKCLQR